jgi:malonate-semialdehyde dehydrogenase (acetylating) / methylmalonate-semialdehyde dehydrogenase
VVHGTHDVVNRICDHPDIKAVSLVGSNAAGTHVYSRACATGKRVQANTGAKNHAVVMPDADVDSTVKALTGAAFGAAGQRCMAISAVVFVGGIDRWREPLATHAKALKVRECTTAQPALCLHGRLHAFTWQLSESPLHASLVPKRMPSMRRTG